jgi:hypothetical protein
MGDSARYNTVAKKIMDKHNIPIDDQYRFVMANKEKMQRPNDVHFSKESSLALARQAVAAIKKALNE